ncbi:acylamino-acid-releasing enzyme isoform X1 [Octopus bimaculoides]|uniref:Acylamino-acid-releasing enzyme n=1 Tax=Octopus bimaculoides TaxID=37653 RepID=A0A0L8HRR9_OCTBM|nr:acylamino-acid-releasing enzyme isoform X1 [Octopus bimaculoides]|eukprot:XP_014770020.1 PREDICTED: acylamino-acid-releasing enzyme-like [Octopus bimaculoides]
MQPYRIIKKMMSTGKVIKDYLVEEAISIYREYSRFPVVSSAKISFREDSSHIIVNSESTQRDLERREQVKFSRNHILTHEHGKYSILCRTPPTELSKELWNKESPSGKLRCIIRRVTNQKGEEKDFIEIWEKTRKIWNIDALSKEIHGKIYEPDGQFGSLEWSATEKRLVYIAEKKLPKATSYFDAKNTSRTPDDETKPSETKARGDQHVLHEDWGEMLVGKHHPIVAILDLEGSTPEISLLDCVSDDVSLGQVRWAPDETGLVMVGWSHEPWRLGLTYCPIRKSQLYFAQTSGEDIKCFGDEDKAVRSPSFSPDGKKIVYMDNPASGPHYQCSRLLMIDWVNKETKVVLDVVDQAKDDEFAGVFVHSLPDRCWSSDSKRVLFSTVSRSHLVPVVVNTETQKVTRIKSPESGVSALQILDVHHDHIVAQFSAPNQPQYLVIGYLPPEGEEDTIEWVKLDAELNHKLDGITVELLKHKPIDGMINEEFPDLEFESIFLRPSECADSKFPLVVWSHGGPHSAFMGDFQLYPAAMCSCGFAVLLVNYRGSIGCGQNSIKSLLGKIGHQDVQDVQFAAESLLKLDYINENHVTVIGGSHGGFITLHLIGQYPDFYKAAVCRNPVTSLLTIFGSSDIPDWAFVECGLDFKHGKVADMESLETFWKMSPTRYVDQVITPTMFMVGTADLRVPPKCALEYYKALKARKIPVRFMSYAENSHPLNKVDAEADAFVNIVSWFWYYIC